MKELIKTIATKRWWSKGKLWKLFPIEYNVKLSTNIININIYQGLPCVQNSAIRQFHKELLETWPCQRGCLWAKKYLKLFLSIINKISTIQTSCQALQLHLSISSTNKPTLKPASKLFSISHNLPRFLLSLSL